MKKHFIHLEESYHFLYSFTQRPQRLTAKAAKNFVSNWNLVLVHWNFLKRFPANRTDLRKIILQSLINQSPFNPFGIWPSSAEASAGKNTAPGISFLVRINYIRCRVFYLSLLPEDLHLKSCPPLSSLFGC